MTKKQIKLIKDAYESNNLEIKSMWEYSKEHEGYTDSVAWYNDNDNTYDFGYKAALEWVMKTLDINFKEFNIMDIDNEELPTEEEYSMGSNLETDKQIEEYIVACLFDDYGVQPKAFNYEYDCSKVYVHNIQWGRKGE